MRELGLTVATALVVLATTALVAPPSGADTESWTDAAGDVDKGGGDITGVTLKNNKKAVAIRIDIDDLSAKQGVAHRSGSTPRHAGQGRSS